MIIIIIIIIIIISSSSSNSYSGSNRFCVQFCYYIVLRHRARYLVSLLIKHHKTNNQNTRNANKPMVTLVVESGGVSF
jgi:hypothetical protein